MYLQLNLAARYLLGRKLRTFLTTLAVAFGVLVIVGTNTIMPTMLAAFRTNLLSASGQVDVTVRHRTDEAFKPSVLRQVKAVSGIRAAAGSLSRSVNIPDGFYGRDARIGAVTLTGLDPQAAATLRRYPMKEGRFLRAGDDNAAVITTSLAESLGLRLGDTLRLPTTQGVVKLQVVGLLPARTIPGNEEVLIDLSEAQKLFDLPGRINAVEATLDTTDEARRATITSAIEVRLGPDYRLGAMSSETELMASVKTGEQLFNLFGFLSLLMGGFIIFNTFRTIVAERRHDIGMLRAVGASRRTVVGLILAEGLLQGLIGAAVGLGLGYLFGLGFTALVGPVGAQFWHLEIGSVVINPLLLAVAAVLGIGVTLLAGLLPALSASRVTPLEALRPPVAEAAQRVASRPTVTGAVLVGLAPAALLSGNVGLIALGGLLFLLGLVLVAPIVVRPVATVFGRLIALAFAREGTGALAQGNLTRQPSRAAITASATMVGLAIVVALGGMTASVTTFSMDTIRKTLGSDYMLLPPSAGLWARNVGADARLAARLRAVPGVQAVSTVRFAAAQINGESVSLMAIDPAVFPQVASLNFQKGDARTAFAALAAGRALIVNGPFAAEAGLEVGDAVRLSTPTGERPYRVAAIADDFFNAKLSAAYVSQANLRVDFRKTEDIFIQINLAPGARPAEVEPRLQGIVADYPQFKLLSREGYLAEIQPQLQAAFGSIYVLLAVLAFPSLIALLNTLAIGIIERTREIGMLRAVGALRRQVRRMVIGESLLLAAIGTSLGILAGLYLGYVMARGAAAAGFAIVYAFPAAGLVAAVATGLIFGVVAALLPARQAARLDIVRALRYE